MISSRILYSTVVLLFGAGIVLVSILRLAQPDIFIKFKMASQLNLTAKQTVFLQQLAQQKDNNPYILPTPTLLPNHPFYWLKMIQDRIFLEFTFYNTPERLLKYLEYADDRLVVGLNLFFQFDSHLAVTTLTKSEKYLFQADSWCQDYREKCFPNGSTQLAQQITLRFLVHQNFLEEVIDSQLLDNRDQEILSQILQQSREKYDARWKEYAFEATNPANLK